jgi:RNA polymerase sigma factor (sigma-70 family)
MAGAADHHLVDDVVAEAYQKIWMSMPRLLVGRMANTDAYVLIAARNTFLDHMRSARRSRTTPVPSDELPRLTEDATVLDSAETVIARAMVDHVLETLPTRTREVLRLYLAEFSNAEIAQHLGISSSTVAAHIRKARRHAHDLSTEERGLADSRPSRKQAEDFERESRKRDAFRLHREGRELKEGGDLEGAEARFWQADALGDKLALMEVAELCEAADDTAAAERIYRRALAAGERTAISKLASLRDKAGDRTEAESLYWQAVRHGDPSALTVLARLRDEAGDGDGAERIARQAAETWGASAALSELAWRREQAGDLAAAERLYREAIAHGDRSCRGALAHLRDLAGDRAEAEALARKAATEGDTSVLKLLAKAREFGGDTAAAEAFYWQAVEAEDNQASVYEIVKLRAEQGDMAGAASAAKSVGGPADRTTAELLRRLTTPPKP